MPQLLLQALLAALVRAQVAAHGAVAARLTHHGPPVTLFRVLLRLLSPNLHPTAQSSVRTRHGGVGALFGYMVRQLADF